MTQFNIQAHLHRFEGQSKIRTTAWIRYYARIETAIRRCSEYLVVEGQVGDVIEFVLIKIPGYQLGTVRLKATGHLDILWNTADAAKIRNQQLLCAAP